MGLLKPYDVVRVFHLPTIENALLGTESIKRKPAIGDMGTIVEVLSENPDQEVFMVECLDNNGTTLWLTIFKEEELEFIRHPDPKKY
jgi:hypothetical protein